MAISVSRGACPALFGWFAANAAFSCGFAVLFLIAPNAVAGAIGMPYLVVISVIGGVLAAFAALLVYLVYRGSMPRSLAWAIVMTDMGWVLGTVIVGVLMPEMLNTQGWILAAVIAFVVLVFSVGQAESLRRLDLVPTDTSAKENV